MACAACWAASSTTWPSASSFAYSDTRQRLAALRQPLGELLASEPGRTELNALYDSLNRLHRLQEGELAKALGIPMGFNAHDGD